MRALVLLSCLSGCATLDSFVWNPVHCSRIEPGACVGTDNGWDAICLTCDEPYDWTKDYPWMPGTLDDDIPSVRPIPNDEVVGYRIPTADGLGELDAVFLPATGDDPALASTTILYNHGNYAGLEHYQPRLRMLHELGYNVFAWDYRGFGKSEPATTPTPDEIVADAHLVRDFAAGVVPDPDAIIVYAYSIGAIPAVEMALHDEPCALFLEAPFTSLHSGASTGAWVGLPEQFLSEGRYDNVAKLEGYPGAVLGMVGSLDNKFPADSVRAMVDGVAGPHHTWIVEGARHGVSNGGIVEAGLTPYRDTMRAFLDEHAPGCLP